MSDSDAINAAYASELGTLFSSCFTNSTGDSRDPAKQVADFTKFFSRAYKSLQATRDAALVIVTSTKEKSNGSI